MLQIKSSDAKRRLLILHRLWTRGSVRETEGNVEYGWQRKLMDSPQINATEILTACWSEKLSIIEDKVSSSPLPALKDVINKKLRCEEGISDSSSLEYTRVWYRGRKICSIQLKSTIYEGEVQVVYSLFACSTGGWEWWKTFRRTRVHSSVPVSALFGGRDKSPSSSKQSPCISEAS